MKAKDIFSLAIRLLGLLFIYLAVRSISVIFVGLPDEAVTTSIFITVLYLTVGWWMLGGASLLMDRAYPSEEAKHEDE